MRSDDKFKASEQGSPPVGGDGGGRYRRAAREPVEVALELRGLSAVLFVAACEARVARGALLLASEALAEAPLHTHDDSGRALLGLVRAAGVALRGGIHALTASEAPQIEVTRAVSIRLARIEAELGPY